MLRILTSALTFWGLALVGPAAAVPVAAVAAALGSVGGVTIAAGVTVAALATFALNTAISVGVSCTPSKLLRRTARLCAAGGAE